MASRAWRMVVLPLLVLANFDHVFRLHGEARDIHAMAVHTLMCPWPDQLAALRPRRSEAHPVDDVVQPALQHVQKIFRP